MNDRKLKVALVGCGQIADAHLQEARKIPGVEVVGVCDRHLDLARQAAARFGVSRVFTDLDLMLEQLRPDVVHVTTPPHSHHLIARRALASGAHIYLEKPFTVDVAEADDVLDAARAAGRLVCVGHDQLFDPAWEELRRRHQGGEFGKVLHVDAVMGYDLAGPFGKVLVSDPEHWVHRLPGGLFHNAISHALYKITDFLPDERPRIWATWFANQPGVNFPTDLRVMLRGETMTANLLFISGMKPTQRVARIYGTRRCVEIDLDGRVLRHSPPASWPGPFAKIQLPLQHLREALGSLTRNALRFARSDLHYFAGMNRLFRLFYQAIRAGGEPPIPYAEIRRVTALMDDIFEVCRADAERAASLDGPLPESISCGA
jgi:predicted dehydrogenase